MNESLAMGAWRPKGKRPKLTCDMESRPNAGDFGKLLFFHELRRRKLNENGKIKTLPGLIVTW